ncbi:hypothetical protein E2C01_039899 [Portunus trituberculatus]|uniref:Uncharacterized protein n=1 Tax=Portunus trituberculatus TaxID=210409 RepID=A0A5B7FLF0_PORTR|nr:hypothetical protein [Portunus trituberculatus]
MPVRAVPVKECRVTRKKWVVPLQLLPKSVRAPWANSRVRVVFRQSVDPCHPAATQSHSARHPVTPAAPLAGCRAGG